MILRGGDDKLRLRPFWRGELTKFAAMVVVSSFFDYLLIWVFDDAAAIVVVVPA